MLHEHKGTHHAVKLDRGPFRWTPGYRRPVDTMPALPFTDEELAALALAADPQTTVADDAVPLREFLGSQGDGDLLPAWYMPAPADAGRLLHGWRRRIVLLIIVSFVLINAYGLCSTYGYISFD